MAEIIHTTYDSKTHQPLVPPAGLSEERRDTWLDSHDWYVDRRCSNDRTPVEIYSAGTSEYAQCRRGHRWYQTFGPAGWVQQEAYAPR